MTGLLFQKDETDFDSDKSRQEVSYPGKSRFCSQLDSVLLAPAFFMDLVRRNSIRQEPCPFVFAFYRGRFFAAGVGVPEGRLRPLHARTG